MSNVNAPARWNTMNTSHFRPSETRNLVMIWQACQHEVVQTKVGLGVSLPLCERKLKVKQIIERSLCAPSGKRINLAT